MIPWIKKLLYDPESFSNFVRAGLYALGELPTVINFGEAGAPLYWVGKLLQILALTVRHGSAAPPEAK
jgi:hypothetical protein